MPNLELLDAAHLDATAGELPRRGAFPTADPDHDYIIRIHSAPVESTDTGAVVATFATDRRGSAPARPRKCTGEQSGNPPAADRVNAERVTGLT